MNLKNLNLSYSPKIVVTTKILADSTHEFLHYNGVNMIFHKKHKNYSAEAVVRTLLQLHNSCSSITYNNTSGDKEESYEGKLNETINKELDLIGVAPYLIGRKYLFDSIKFTIESIDNTDNNTTVVQHLVNKYKKSNTSITKGMHNAILHAFRVSAPDTLEQLYTGTVNYETGYPTPTDFMHYYARKIAKEL